jgi:hypothetical protein
VRRFLSRHGTEAVMHTARIGRAEHLDDAADLPVLQARAHRSACKLWRFAERLASLTGAPVDQIVADCLHAARMQ